VRRNHDPGWAAVLSFLLPGLGQIYNGRFGRAIGFIIAWGVALAGNAWVYTEYQTYEVYRNLVGGDNSNPLAWLIITVPFAIGVVAFAVADAFYDVPVDPQHASAPNPVEQFAAANDPQDNLGLPHR